MSDPRAQLLEAARDLFVRQGYTQTTIQQLAEHAGISKGAVYLHFRSKSDVMLAVVRDHEDSVLDAVRAIALRDDLEPRDKLKAQLRYQFTEMHEERLLLEAFLKESGVAVDEELILIAQKTRREWQRLQEEFVRLAFPEHDPAFTTDIAACLNGALNEYYTYVLLEGVEIEPDEVAELLVRLAAALGNDLKADRGLVPVLQPNLLPDEGEIERLIQKAANQRVEQALNAIEEAARGERDDSEAEEIEEIVEALRHALAQEPRSRVVLQGLVANLREHKDLAAARKSLAYELGLKLI